MATDPPPPPLLGAMAKHMADAEDALAFFARAAILRHCASVALSGGAIGEAARLTGLAKEAEAKVAAVVRRVAGQLAGPPAPRPRRRPKP